jgi:hypothetical protein
MALRTGEQISCNGRSALGALQAGIADLIEKNAQDHTREDANSESGEYNHNVLIGAFG